MAFLKKHAQASSQPLFDTLSSLVLIVGSVVLPLFYLPFTRDVLFFPKSLLFLGIVLTGILLWLLRVVISKELYVRRTILDIPIVFFLGVAVVSAFASYSQSLSFLGRVDEYVFHIVGLLTGALWFWLLIQYVSTTVLWRWMSSLLLLSGVLISTAFLFRGVTVFQGITSVVGVNLISDTTSIFGAFIAVLTVLALGLLMVKGRGIGEQILPGIMAVLGVIVLLRVGFTLTWLMFAIGCVGLVILGFTMLAESRLPVVVGVFSLFIVAVLFVFLGSPQTVRATLPIEISLGAKTSWDVSSQAVLSNAKSFLFGSGPGTFIYSFSSFRPSEFNVNELVWSIRFRQPYNTFFAMLSEIGLLGVLTWLFLVLFSCGSILSAWFKTKPSILGRVRQAVAKEITHNTAPHVRLRLEIFVLVSAWVALTFGFFVLYYDMMMWWLWWTLLGLVFTGLSAILPDIMSDKKIFLQVSPQYSLAVSFGMVCVFVAVVLFGAFQGRLFVAEAHFTKASQVTAVDDVQQSVDQALLYRGGYVPYRLASARIHLQQARILAEQTEPDAEAIATRVAQAVNDARYAADADAKNVETWETLAAMYMNARLFASEANAWAQDALTQVITLEPTNAIAHWRLADTYAFSQEYTQAEKLYRQAIVLKPNHLDMYNSLSQLYEIQSDLDKAISVYEPILSSLTNNPEVLFSLGRLFYNRDTDGDIAQARALWEQSIAVAPNFSNALFSLGLLHETAGEDQKALGYYRRVLELNPDNADVSRKVRLLSQ